MPFNFADKITKFKKLKATLPAQVGVIAKNHFKASFRNQGFTDQRLDPWEKRSTKDKSDRARPSSPRAILVKTGHGRNAIRVKSANWDAVAVESPVKYMQYHNNGEGNNPQRRFMGKSAQLNRKILAKINKEMKSIL